MLSEKAVKEVLRQGGSTRVNGVLVTTPAELAAIENPEYGDEEPQGLFDLSADSATSARDEDTTRLGATETEEQRKKREKEEAAAAKAAADAQAKADAEAKKKAEEEAKKNAGGGQQ